MPLNVTEKKRKRQEAAATEAIAKASKAARIFVEGCVETSDRGRIAEQELASLSILPSIAVFDLDDTVWVGDIDMTSGPPFRTDGRGLPILAKNGGHGDKIVPFPDVPEIFDWLEAHEMKVAVSTHTFKPSWAEEALSLMETARGTKYTDLLVCPIASEVQRKNKDVHMRAIAVGTGCECQDMVFFDDKDHNVKDGRRAGTVSCMVASDGLTWDKFVQCMREFEQKRAGSSQPSMPQSAMPKAMTMSGLGLSQDLLTLAEAQLGGASSPSGPAMVRSPLPKAAAIRPAAPKAAGWRPQWAGAAAGRPQMAMRPQYDPQWNNPQLAALAAQLGWAQWGTY